jgi:hypothetical protein
VEDSSLKHGIRSIAWGGNKFVAGGHNYCAYSSDGINWRTAVEDMKLRIESIAWGGNKFVAADGSKMAYSTDGITWTPVMDYTFFNESIYSIAWGNGKFVAGGSGGKMAWSGN